MPLAICIDYATQYAITDIVTLAIGCYARHWYASYADYTCHIDISLHFTLIILLVLIATFRATHYAFMPFSSIADNSWYAATLLMLFHSHWLRHYCHYASCRWWHAADYTCHYCFISILIHCHWYYYTDATHFFFFHYTIFFATLSPAIDTVTTTIFHWYYYAIIAWYAFAIDIFIATKRWYYTPLLISLRLITSHCIEATPGWPYILPPYILPLRLLTMPLADYCHYAFVIITPLRHCHYAIDIVLRHMIHITTSFFILLSLMPHRHYCHYAMLILRWLRMRHKKYKVKADISGRQARGSRRRRRGRQEQAAGSSSKGYFHIGHYFRCWCFRHCWSFFYAIVIAGWWGHYWLDFTH